MAVFPAITEGTDLPFLVLQKKISLQNAFIVFLVSCKALGGPPGLLISTAHPHTGPGYCHSTGGAEMYFNTSIHIFL
jgi:hypothetical protein